jgi:hypothetical protein
MRRTRRDSQPARGRPTGRSCRDCNEHGVGRCDDPDPARYRTTTARHRCSVRTSTTAAEALATCIFELHEEALERYRAELRVWQERKAKKASG